MISNAGFLRLGVGQQASMELSTDLPGTITWTKVSGPAWATIGASTGIVGGTATAGGSGLLIVTAANGTDTDTTSVRLVVVDGLAAVYPRQRGAPGSDVLAAPQLFGVGGTLRFTPSRVPACIVVDPTTGVVTGPMPSVNADGIIVLRDGTSTALAVIQFRPDSELLAILFEGARINQQGRQFVEWAAGETVDLLASVPEGEPPFTGALDAAPDWMGLTDGDELRLNGTATVGGSGLIRISARDSADRRALGIGWAVVIGDAPTLRGILPARISGPSGTPAPDQFIRVEGGVPPYRFEIVSAAALAQVDANGRLSGITFGATAGGNLYTVSVRITDSVGNSVIVSMEVGVDAGPVGHARVPDQLYDVFEGDTLATALLRGAPRLRLEGGTAEEWILEDKPSWITLGDDGVLNGTAPTVGVNGRKFEFFATAVTADGQRPRGKVVFYVLDSAAPVILSGGGDINIREGDSGSRAIVFSNHPAVAEMSVRMSGIGVPEWMSWDSATNELRWTNAVVGTYQLTVTFFLPYAPQVNNLPGTWGRGVNNVRLTVTVARRTGRVSACSFVPSVLRLRPGESGEFELQSDTADPFRPFTHGSGHSRTINLSAIADLGELGFGGIDERPAIGEPYRFRETWRFTAGATPGTATGTAFVRRLPYDSSIDTTTACSIQVIVGDIACTVPALTATVGGTYSGSMSASGGTAPYTYEFVEPPEGIGLAMSSAGVFSGTATQPARFSTSSFPFSVRVTDANGSTGICSGSVRLSVPGITCAPAPALSGSLGSFSDIVQIPRPTGAVGNVIYGKQTGPDWLTIFADGRARLLPTATGTFNYTYTVRDSNGSTCVSAVGAIFVGFGAFAPSARATVGAAATATIQADGGRTPYTYALVSPAAGLSISGNVVTLAAQTAPGTVNYTVRVTDAAGASLETSGTFTVGYAALSCTAPDASGTTGTATTATVSGSGGDGSYTFALVAENTDAGITISGTTVTLAAQTSTGDHDYEVRVTDGQGTTSTCSGTFTVSAPTAPLTCHMPLTRGVVNTDVTVDVTASGGTGPYTYAFAHPAAGLSISGNTVTINLSSPATFSLAVRVTDAANNSVTCIGVVIIR